MNDELEVKYHHGNITPFWKKLPFFFLFPSSRMSPLIFMVCIVAASGLAAITFGAFGLIFKGFLVYLGLRYAFNVLELFARGRFEGESVDHTLWGPEKRPAKLGLVITLFVVFGINFGNVMLDSRLAKDPRAQDVIIERYNKEHAAEIAQREEALAAYKKHLADVLIQRRNTIARVYLTAINPIVAPRLEGGRLTFDNAAVAAGVATGATTYRAAWSLFNNATGETQPIATTESATTTLAVPGGVPTPPGSFVEVTISAENAAFPTWRQPIRTHFRRDATNWTLVGLERLPDSLPTGGTAQK